MAVSEGYEGPPSGAQPRGPDSSMHETSQHLLQQQSPPPAAASAETQQEWPAQSAQPVEPPVQLSDSDNLQRSRSTTSEADRRRPRSSYRHPRNQPIPPGPNRFAAGRMSGRATRDTEGGPEFSDSAPARFESQGSLRIPHRDPTELPNLQDRRIPSDAPDTPQGHVPSPRAGERMHAAAFRPGVAHTIFPQMIQPIGRHHSHVYFISVHDEEPHNKTSNRALRRLRSVPLNEVPPEERQCTICYEPLEEIPEAALRQQAELAVAENANSAAAEVAAHDIASSRDASVGVDSAEYANAQGAADTQAALPPRGDDAPPLEPLDGHSALQLPCNHTFGASCLRSWLKNSTTCPLCRKSIEPRRPRAGGTRHHIIHRQEDFERMWATVLRPYTERAAAANGGRPSGEDAPDATTNDEDTANAQPRVNFPLDIGEIVNALNIHTEYHRRQREQFEQDNWPTGLSPQPAGSDAREDGEDTYQDGGRTRTGPEPPRGDANARNGEAEERNDEPHMHLNFHFSVDDATPTEVPYPIQPPQEYVFDIRIMPEVGTYMVNQDAQTALFGEENRATPLRNLPDLVALRAQQRGEMIRSVERLRSRESVNEPRNEPQSPLMDNAGTPHATNLASSNSANTPGVPRPLSTSESPSAPPASRGGPSISGSSGQAGEPSEEALPQTSELRFVHERFGVPEGILQESARFSSGEADSPAASIEDSLLRPEFLRPQSSRPETVVAERSRAELAAVGETAPQPSRDLGDTSIDEGLFQAFRRHFGASESQQEILAEQLNERLPPAESRTHSPADAMLVDSDLSRSVTPSADAPAVSEEDNDVMRSGPTRRAARRHHPYTRS